MSEQAPAGGTSDFYRGLEGPFSTANGIDASLRQVASRNYRKFFEKTLFFGKKIVTI